MAKSKKSVDDLIKFYRGVVESFGFEEDSEGRLSMSFDERSFPSMIDEKRLVMPTREVLRRSNWEEEIAFHPLSENIYRGESKILKKLKKQICFRVTSVINCLITELATIAANTEQHEGLSPKQSRILDILPKANSKTVAAFTKVLDRVSFKDDSEYRLVNIYLKHGGKFQGEQCSRVAVVNFPITEEFSNKNQTIFGVKFSSKRDFESFVNLWNYLLPNSIDSEEYNFGSKHMEVPYFEALMGSYHALTKTLNSTVWLYRKYLDDYASLHTNLDWYEEMNHLSVYRGLIPVLKGNDGDPVIDTQSMEEKPVEAPVASQGYPGFSGELQQPVVSKPVQPSIEEKPPWEHQAPVQQSDTVSWSEIVSKRSQQSFNPYPTQQHPPVMAPPGWIGTPVQGVGPNQSFRNQPPVMPIPNNTYGGYYQQPMVPAPYYGGMI